MIVFLVGNKVDEKDNRKISYQECSEFAKQNNLSYIETSAKTGENINELFNQIAKQIYETLPDNEKFGDREDKKNLN